MSRIFKLRSVMKLFVLGLIVIMGASLLPAQSLFLEGPASTKGKLTFRYVHPSFKEVGSNMTALSGNYEVGVSIPVLSRLNFVGSLPYLTYGYNYDWYGYTDKYRESGLGNLSVGLQYLLKSTENEKTSVSLIASLPTMKSDDEDIPYFAGMLANYTEIGKYFPETLTLRGNFAHHAIKKSGLMYGVEVGPDALIPTDDSSERKVELFLHYGGMVGYRAPLVDIVAEVVGNVYLTGEDYNYYDDNSDNLTELTFGVSLNRGRIRPGVYYSAILFNKEFKEYLKGKFGIKVEIDLKK